MRQHPYDLALRLRDAPVLSPEEELAQRIRLVLETETGQIPWEPSFGCDLSGLVGRVGDTQRIARVRMQVQGALRRWLPDIEIASVQVELVELSRLPGTHTGVPVAEAVMASEGISARMNVQILVETPTGPLEVNALLT